jgi:membrane associated rhomboid family serine protease
VPYNFDGMRCPRDGTKLFQRKQQPGIHDCLKCRGQTLSSGFLARALPTHVVKWLWEISASDGPCLSMRCPRCSSFLRQAPTPPEHGSFEIDLCGKCRLAWFDRGELTGSAIPDASPPVLADADQSRLVQSLASALLKIPIEEDPTHHQSWSQAFGVILLATLGLSLLGFRNVPEAAQAWGFIPALAVTEVHRWITSFFFHDGWAHLLGNLYFLWILGDDVEDFLGTENFAVLLLASAVGGNFAVYLSETRVDVPHIGASGGISGLFAVYSFAFPKARLCFAKIWTGGVGVLRLPASIVFIAFFLYQFALQLRGPEYASGISVLSHIGGASVGLIGYLLLPKRG